jgi:hypothetical protein
LLQRLNCLGEHRTEANIGLEVSDLLGAFERQ